MRANCERQRDSATPCARSSVGMISYVCCITVFTENVTKKRPAIEIATTAVVESATAAEKVWSVMKCLSQALKRAT